MDLASYEHLKKLKVELSFSKGYTLEDRAKMTEYLEKCRIYNYPKDKEELTR